MNAMNQRPSLLVVCARNKKRSRTAEHVFKQDARFNIRSAGLSPQSDHKITQKDLAWADLVLVMEPEHRARIRKQFGHLALPAIEVLHIPDEYEFMDEELVDRLYEGINAALAAYQ